MLGRSFGAVLAAVAALTIFVSALPALADGTENVYQQSILPGANTAIKNFLDQQQAAREKARRQASATSPSVAQAPPVPQQRTGPVMALPGERFTYTAAISAANPYGNIGSYGRGWLMGGTDLTAAYHFNWSTRLMVSMFQLQHWPEGFNSGLAPVYLAGFRNPVGCADLSDGTACGPGTGRNINVATKDTFGVFMLNKLFVIKSDKLPGPLPIVITPTYVARGGIIAFAPGHNDVVPFTYNLPDGPVENIPVRTAQYYAVAVTLPFLKTPKMFATFTVAPQWIVHTAGANVGNSMQLPQVLYFEYTPTRTTTLFFEPQSARDYLPTDPYPEHLFAYFLGVSQRLTKYSFVQAVLNSGGVTNLGPDGIVGIKCLTAQQAINNACGLAIGGLKATQLQLELGIGSPSVFPL
ncbi:MAG TPA: hypothetical protein VNU22_09240 [Candidatus Acidoferrum sp.]|jgi:hypothetical protein|nr:hypothetical protein [Candidatus Acidoferrum sp.]